jgi:hypothetical protein
MEDVEFRIEVHCPITLTLEAAQNVVAQAIPKWRSTRISFQQIEGNAFECKVGIDSRDVSREDTANLIQFRDTFLSLFSLTGMVPVRPLTKGTFTFALGEGNYAQLSLGPMNYIFSGSAIRSFAPVVGGFAFDESHLGSIWFIWQAINSNEAVHRFLNLAVAYELVVASNSPAEGSKKPRCNYCAQEFSPCAFCGKENKIPETLRERARFLFAEEKLLRNFIDFRNRFFHGRVAGLKNDDVAALVQLNTGLLVNIRNHFGRMLGLQNVAAAEIGWSVNVPEIFATVFYEQGH